MKAGRRAGVKSFLLRAAVFWRLKVKPWLDNHAQKVGIPQECAQHQLPNMGSKALKCWRNEKEDAPSEAGGNIEVFNTYMSAVGILGQSETWHKIRNWYKFGILCEAGTDFLWFKIRNHYNDFWFYAKPRTDLATTDI